MTLFITIAFVMALAGIFLALDLPPLAFLDGVAALFQPRRTTLKKRIKAAAKQKKPRGIRRLLNDVQEVLRITGKSDRFPVLCVLSMFLFLMGALLAVNMHNFILLPVLAVGFALLPFWYVLFTANKLKKNLNVELETALSVVTSSYLRGQNTFIKAVEENVPYLNPPVADVFRGFLTQTKFINSNMETALQGMKAGIDNDVYREWVDGVIACQQDSNLKATLLPIVSKLSDIRAVTAELDLILFEPVKEYITMALLVLASIPLMYFLNAAWFETLFFTGFGKALLAVCGVVLFISIGGVIRNSRPIEYKR